MNKAIRLGIAAAVVVVAALLGFSYLVAPNVGGPGPGDPIPTPTPVPTPVPTLPLLSGLQLEPGTYRLNLPGFVNATVTVPEGWANFDGYAVNKNLDEPSSAAVIFWPPDAAVGLVYADPCQWQDGYVDPPVGPTVDDLANVLANQPQRGDEVPIDVSIDGFRGKMIELSVPSDIDFADCDEGEFRSWEGRFHQGPGQIDRFYILDISGQRLVIDAFFLPGTSEVDRAELEAIVDSIQLGEP